MDDSTGRRGRGESGRREGVREREGVFTCMRCMCGGDEKMTVHW